MSTTTSNRKLYCCNPFQLEKHKKKKTKNMKKITHQLCDVLQKNNISVLSRNLLCGSCYFKAMKIKNKLQCVSDLSKSSLSSNETAALTSSFARKQVLKI